MGYYAYWAILILSYANANAHFHVILHVNVHQCDPCQSGVDSRGHRSTLFCTVFHRTRLFSSHNYTNSDKEITQNARGFPWRIIRTHCYIASSTSHNIRDWWKASTTWVYLDLGALSIWLGCIDMTINCNVFHWWKFLYEFSLRALYFGYAWSVPIQISTPQYLH